MWENPTLELSAIPLYDSFHFSTLPRKKVSKNSWCLIQNSHSNLLNRSEVHQLQIDSESIQTHTNDSHITTRCHHNIQCMNHAGGDVGHIGLCDEFRCHNHSERLMHKMEACASRHQLCDVVLIAGTRRIPAHRLVLSAASDYFAAMFMNNVRESTMDEVEIKDVDPDALDSLIHYTYTGRIDMREDTVETLLSTASLLQLSEVKEACCNFLMKQLHPSNCIGIRQFADLQGCSDLYKVANNYLMEVFMDVVQNSEFLMLPGEDVCSLLVSDDLNVSDEEAIFAAVVKWVKHDLSARRKYLPRLLSHVKLPLMTPQYIADHIESNCLFRGDVECQQLIVEALKYHLLPERRSFFQSSRTRPRKSTVGALYVVGGVDSSNGNASIEKYDLRTNTWTQVGHMAGHRMQFGAAVLDGKLYVVGGRNGFKTVNTVECYDPVRKSWKLMPSMATHRHGLGVGVMAGPLYAVGGHDGWTYLCTVERWDPQAGQWSFVAPLISARSTVGVADLHGKLYAVGGRDSGSYLSSVECFHPHTNKWSLCSSMAHRRGGVGVATCSSFLYAVGGHEAPAVNPADSRYDTVERYDPKTDQWTVVAPISSPRDAVGLCALGGKLMAVGGHDGHQYLCDVECYDADTDTWTKVSPLCTARACACVVRVANSCHI